MSKGNRITYGETITTIKGWANFIRIVEPDTYDEDNPKYKLNFIFEPDSAFNKKVKELAPNLAKERWGNKKNLKYEVKIKDGNDMDFSNLEEKDPERAQRLTEFYTDKLYIIPTTRFKPGVDTNKKGNIACPVVNHKPEAIDPSIIKNGDRVILKVSMFACDVPSKIIGFHLNGVQHLGKGEPLGGDFEGNIGFSAVEMAEEEGATQQEAFNPEDVDLDEVNI